MNRSSAAFTLWELVLTVAVVSILAGIAYPLYSGVRQSGEDRVMVARALALEAAMIAFVDRTPEAQSLWSTWDEAEKYNQLIIRGHLLGRGLSWQAYQGDYTLIWPEQVNARILIYDAQSRQVVYE